MRTVGVVELYNEKRGFGFLRTGKSEIYFNISDWCAADVQPERGVVVSYEVQPARNPKFKNQAVRIKNLTTEEAIEATFSRAASVLAGSPATVTSTSETPATAAQEVK